MRLSRRLFWHRLKWEWKHKWKDFRSVADWTVLLYIIIPGMIIAVINYVEWWSEIPVFAAFLPEPIWLIILYFASRFAVLRVFLQEADQIYLLQHGKIMKGIMLRGIAYSLLQNVLINGFTLIILLPFLFIHLGYSIVHVLMLFGIIVLVSWNMMFISQFITIKIPNTVIRVFALAAVNGIAIVFYLVFISLSLSDYLSFVAVISGLMVGFFQLLKMRLSLKGAFFEDVQRERKYYLSWTSLLVQGSGMSETKSFRTRKEPLLFKGSSRLLKGEDPVTRLVDSFLKWYIRQFSKIQYYLQIVGVCVLAAILLPVWVKFLVWLFGGFALISWKKADWNEFEGGGYLMLYKWDVDVKTEAAKKSLKFLTLPGFLVISYVTGAMVYSWTGGFIFLVAGWFVHKALIMILRPFYFENNASSNNAKI
ncbi:ABC transporter permease [Pseudalkalibacillus caeni]|uniref:Uncharacterized protein n=1 Tax=Exobacillus caeni TaxID=2574798 RepID=A0A5R9F2W2_9BACL|nr:ABC transporter permease [Pseudalkalibacillus caeni]TLS36656.1 hypothetical protein FCL54_14135 [Pseudalkalibacillus caeni]